MLTHYCQCSAFCEHILIQTFFKALQMHDTLGDLIDPLLSKYRAVGTL